MTKLCEFCGAYSPRQCELRDETGGVCPWEEILEDEPDPDFLREQRDDMRRIFGDDSHDPD